MSEITKTVSIYNDGQGYVARCTESDQNGPIVGRVAMDESLVATTIDEARREAAEHFGVDLEEVK